MIFQSLLFLVGGIYWISFHVFAYQFLIIHSYGFDTL